MTISKNNIFAKFYRWMYLETPKDFCSFFWGTLKGFFIIPGRLVNYELPTVFTLTIYMVYFIMLFFGGVSYIDYFDLITEERNITFNELFTLLSNVELFLIAPIIGIFVTLFYLIAAFLMISPIFGIGYGMWYIMRKRNTTRTENTKNVIAAIRGKYCVKIEWKD